MVDRPLEAVPPKTFELKHIAAVKGARGTGGEAEKPRSREAEFPERSREAEKPRSREAEFPGRSREAEKPRSRIPRAKPRSREAEFPGRSREAEKPNSSGEAEKPRSRIPRRSGEAKNADMSEPASVHTLHMSKHVMWQHTRHTRPSAMDWIGTHCTHVQTSDVIRVQSAIM